VQDRQDDKTQAVWGRLCIEWPFVAEAGAHSWGAQDLRQTGPGCTATHRESSVLGFSRATSSLGGGGDRGTKVGKHGVTAAGQWHEDWLAGACAQQKPKTGLLLGAAGLHQPAEQEKGPRRCCWAAVHARIEHVRKHGGSRYMKREKATKTGEEGAGLQEKGARRGCAHPRQQASAERAPRGPAALPARRAGPTKRSRPSQHPMRAACQVGAAGPGVRMSAQLVGWEAAAAHGVDVVRCREAGADSGRGCGMAGGAEDTTEPSAPAASLAACKQHSASSWASSRARYAGSSPPTAARPAPRPPLPSPHRRSPLQRPTHLRCRLLCRRKGGGRRAQRPGRRCRGRWWRHQHPESERGHALLRWPRGEQQAWTAHSGGRFAQRDPTCSRPHMRQSTTRVRLRCSAKASRSSGAGENLMLRQAWGAGGGGPAVVTDVRSDGSRSGPVVGAGRHAGSTVRPKGAQEPQTSRHQKGQAAGSSGSRAAALAATRVRGDHTRPRQGTQRSAGMQHWRDGAAGRRPTSGVRYCETRRAARWSHTEAVPSWKAAANMEPAAAAGTQVGRRGVPAPLHCQSCQGCTCGVVPLGAARSHLGAHPLGSRRSTCPHPPPRCTPPPGGSRPASPGTGTCAGCRPRTPGACAQHRRGAQLHAGAGRRRQHVWGGQGRASSRRAAGRAFLQQTARIPADCEPLPTPSPKSHPSPCRHPPPHPPHTHLPPGLREQ
jgi:hypothetical protein